MLKAYGLGVISAIDKVILGCHVPRNAKFRFDIVLHLVLVSIQMVRGDVGKNRYIRLEFVHSIQLETTQFQYIVVVIASGYLISVTKSDVSPKSHIVTCILEYEVD